MMDPQDGLLAIALLRQDIEILRTNSKDISTDLDLAINLYEQELVTQQNLLDQLEALIITSATDTDENLLEELNEVGNINNDFTMVPLTTDEISTVIEAIPNTSVKLDELEDPVQAGPSTAVTKKSERFFSITEECNGCLEFRSVNRLLTCKHTYCDDCLINLFRTATIDESLLPVRCCGQELNEEISRNILPAADFQLYNLRLLEFKTSNKLYCPVPTCSRFIPIGSADTKINCPDCNATICVKCKQLQHLGQCEVDLETTELQQLAQSNGWQQCGSCSRYVELHIGCYHITCRCSYEFCYVCGAKWKNCECPQWDENRLMEMARERVANADPDLLAPRIEERALQFAEYLRVNHECQHRWRRRNTYYNNCGNCGFLMRHYLHECRDCLLAACFTCVHHRL